MMSAFHHPFSCYSGGEITTNNFVFLSTSRVQSTLACPLRHQINSPRWPNSLPRVQTLPVQCRDISFISKVPRKSSQNVTGTIAWNNDGSPVAISAGSRASHPGSPAVPPKVAYAFSHGAAGDNKNDKQRKVGIRFLAMLRERDTLLLIER